MTTLLTGTGPTPLLSDVINYVRRILKQPNPEDISDNTIGDYVNRFYLYDMPGRVQLFDLKTTYTLELIPGVDQYNAPVSYLNGQAVVPTYSTYTIPAYVDGYQIVMQQSHDQWFKLFPNRVLNQFQQNGNGTSGPYAINLFEPPVVQGHRDLNFQPPNNTINPRPSNISVSITGATQANPCVLTCSTSLVVGDQVLINNVGGMTQLNGNTYTITAVNSTSITINVDSTNFSLYTSGGTATVQGGYQAGLLTSNVYVTAIDSNGNLNVAQDDPYTSSPYLTPNPTTGNLIQYDPLNPGNPPQVVGSINYQTGVISVTFLYSIPATSEINTQSIPYTSGRPQAVLFFNNTFSFRPIPDKPYVFSIDANYNPAAYLATTNAIPYRFMAEYIARGAARKILQDYGDVEQMMLYEPFFKEQENFVLRKTYRQTSNTRAASIYQGQTSFNPGSYNAI